MKIINEVNSMLKGKKTFVGLLVVLMLVIAGCGQGKNTVEAPDVSKTPESKVEETEKVDDTTNGDSADKTTDEASKETKDDSKTEEKDQKETKEDRTLAPDFTLDDGKGNEMSLSDYKGKLVLVNFFTTWCTYCVEEMPDFNKVYDKYRLEDVAILGVNVQSDPKEISKEKVLDWLVEKKVTFPVVFDDEGQVSRNYYINGYPTTYVIDKEGYIVGYVNAVDEAMLEKIIEMYR